MAGPDSSTHTLDQLTRKLREIERSRTRRASGAAAAADSISTGIEGLDRLLPQRGFPAGTLAEWLASDGAGAGTLAFLAAVSRCRRSAEAETLNLAIRNKALDRTKAPDGALVIIDPQRRWYAPAVSALGVGLDDTIVVCPRRSADALWALEQSLRCPGAAVTIGWFDRLQDRAFRRLKLAVECGGGLGLLLRPETAIRETSWADVRLLVESLPAVNTSPGRRVRVELLRCRGGFQGGDVQLLIDDDVSNSVRVVSDVACTTTLQTAAGA